MPALVLDDAGLKELLRDLARARARIDGADAAAIAELDTRCAYLEDACVSAKVWLAHETGIARAVAGSRVRQARRLRRMPAMADALAAGSVTEQHARALARCLTPRTLAEFARDEESLVAEAAGLDADVFDRVVTKWLLRNDPDGPEPGCGKASELRASRHFEDRVRIDGDLDVEDGAEFLAELEAIYDELWQRDQAADDRDPAKQRSHAERNAEALVEMSRRSSTTRPSVTTGDGDGSSDGQDDGTERDGPRPRRPQLIVVVDLAALGGDPAGSASLLDGSILPRSVLDRWACDSSIGRVVMNGRSVPIDLGAVTYTPSAAQRRALIARDRHCIVPGCKRPARWCEAHHVLPWPFGPTNLANLVLLCRHHHKMVHARVIELRPAGDHWRVFRPDGTPIRQRRPPALAA